MEECFDHLHRNISGSKGQKTSGHVRLIHQEGYVVIHSDSNSLDIVVENVSDCDIVLSFAMVPIGESSSSSNSSSSSSSSSDSSTGNTEEGGKDVESEFLLKIAVQLSQLCVRQSWKVPTLLQNSDVSSSGSNYESGSSAVTTQRKPDVMYTIVEACRYFLKTERKRSEKKSKKCAEALIVCNNVKCGKHVTSGLEGE